jgi:ABC-2 type transport system permease protein
MVAVELIKMLRLPRTWLLVSMLIALPTLVAVLLAVTDLGPRPGTGPPFLSAVLTDAHCSRSQRSESCFRCCCRSRWLS